MKELLLCTLFLIAALSTGYGQNFCDTERKLAF